MIYKRIEEDKNISLVLVVLCKTHLVDLEILLKCEDIHLR